MLKRQQPLLERTLDHPNPTISEPTINIWNSTYGEQIMLDFPQNLLPVLDKLYRSGKIKLCNITCHLEDGINRLQKLGDNYTKQNVRKELKTLEILHMDHSRTLISLILARKENNLRRQNTREKSGEHSKGLQ